MKVDTKITPIEVKEGWFKKKKMHRLEWFITLTEVEKAIINKAGFRDYSYLDIEKPYGIHPFPMWPWIDNESPRWGHMDYDTLFEAQATAQKIKAALVTLKKAMEAHSSTPTEDSFEL